MKAALSIIGTIILLSVNGGSRAAAQAGTCFWQLPGVVHLLGGTDIDMVLHDTASCRPAPRLFVYEDVSGMSGSLFGVAALVTLENELLISYPSRSYCPLCVGCKCVKEFSAPIAVMLPDVDVSRISGFAVTGVGRIDMTGAIDTLAIGIVVNSGLTELLFAEITMYSEAACIIDTKMRYTLKATKTGQEIRGLSAFDGSGAVAVFGSGGLLRVITVADTVSEINHDVNPAEDLSCAGGGYAGSSDGTVYRIGEKQPIVEIGAPLRAVSAAGAGGNSGLLAEYTGTTWNRFDAGDMAVRYFEFLRTDRGKEALIIDEAYGLHRVVICDSATRLAVDTPTALVSALNGPVFNYNGLSTLSARFNLSDPEGNIAPPRIMLHSRDSLRPIVVLDGVAGSCVCGRQNVLNGTSFPLVFTPDSLFFNGNCLNTVCPIWNGETQCSWLAGNCSTSVSWTAGDTVVISAGNDTVRIFNDAAAVIRHDRSGLPASSSLRKAADRALTALRHGHRMPAQLSDRLTMQVYSSQGKLMNRETISRGLSPGFYIVRLGSVSGVPPLKVYIVRSGR